jgi:hypothetical protein
MNLTTWLELSDYLRSRHNLNVTVDNPEITEERPGVIKIQFDVEDLGSQIVLLWGVRAENRVEWVQIEAPFGKLDSVDLRDSVESVGHSVCGGISALGPHAVVRHAVLLSNLDLMDFERSLWAVTLTTRELMRRYRREGSAAIGFNRAQAVQVGIDGLREHGIETTESDWGEPYEDEEDRMVVSASVFPGRGDVSARVWLDHADETGTFYQIGLYAPEAALLLGVNGLLPLDQLNVVRSLTRHRS